MKAFAAARSTSSAIPMQEILDTARRIGSEQAFLVGVRVLAGSISATEAGVAYATIAERLIAALLKEVTREMEEDYGRVPGGAAVVLGMGKLGGREMTASSDVDLILIYDFDPAAEQSDGAKPLSPPQYYTRLTQRLISSHFGAHGGGRSLRRRHAPSSLRPEGPCRHTAIELHGLPGERGMDLGAHGVDSRARVIAGSRELSARVETEIRKVLTSRRDRPKIAADVRDMRSRIEVEKATSDIWDLKQVRGGLVDLEFIIQHLELVHAADHPAILSQTTLVALAAAASEELIHHDDYRHLSEAGQLTS